MKHLSQPDKALDYIAEHPGCSLTEIILATKIPRKSLASLLNKLASDRTLRREGETGKYGYYRLGVRMDHQAWQAATKAMEAKCAALAAENAGLKAAAKETLAHWAAAEPGEMESMMDKCMPSLRVAYCETPATDALLAEVRAQGVEMYASKLEECAKDAECGGFDAAAQQLRSEGLAVREFAAQLRQGGAE